MNYADLIAPQTYASRRFYEKVKLHHRGINMLSKAVGIHPSTVSRIIHRRRKVRMNDPRILKLGKLVGLKRAEIFEPPSKKSAA